MEVQHGSKCDVASLLMEQTLTKSHRYLSNGIYLIKHVKNSIQFLPEIAHQTKLLLYVSNLYEAMVKFTFTFFGYKAQWETNKSPKNIPQEINNLCSLIMDILHITTRKPVGFMQSCVLIKFSL